MAKLGECFSVIRNGASIRQTDGAGGFPITRIETIADKTINREKFGYAEIYDLAQYRDYILQDGDILMSHINSEKHLGKVALYSKQGDEQIIHGMNLLMLRADTQKVIPEYAKYYFESQKFLRQIGRITKKSVNQASFTVTALKELEIPLASIIVQRDISEKLKKVDWLVSLREQQLAKLDELVKARFVEMFGDGQVFNKELLSQNVEEMFIGPFGSSLKNENFVSKENGYCMVYEQKHAIRKTMDVETRYIDKPKYEELKRFSIHGGDIIVSCRGTIGETYIVPLNAPLGIMHPSIMKIRVKDSIYNRVFFDFLLQEKLKQHETQANGSGVKMAVTASALGKEEFIVPSILFQNQFAAFVERVDQQKQTVQQSLEKLELMKKALMQEYFG